MAGVIIDAEMLVEARVAWMLGAEMVEEMNRLGAAFEQAERFGFEAEMQFAPGLFADAGDVLDAAPDIFPDEFYRLGGRMKFLERAGQGADAAFDAGGQISASRSNSKLV